jgi:hypothetical protein
MPRCGQIRALLEQNRPAPLIAVKDLPAGLAARRSHARYVFGWYLKAAARRSCGSGSME